MYRPKQRVVLRSKARAGRNWRALALLVGVAAAVAAWKAAQRPDAKAFLAAGWKDAFKARKVAVAGLPEPLGAKVEQAFSGWIGKPLRTATEDAAAKRLEKEFAVVRLESLEREWLFGTVKLSLARRKPVARTAEGWLDERGQAYAGPESASGLPRTDAKGAPAEDRAQLAAFLAAGAGGIDVKAAGWAEGGWRLELSDGTRVRWGAFGQDREKARRLMEALADARRRLPGAVSADLRFFDQGKVIVHPAGR